MSSRTDRTRTARVLRGVASDLDDVAITVAKVRTESCPCADCAKLRIDVATQIAKSAQQLRRLALQELAS